MGFFGAPKRVPPPHPRREPRYNIPLTADAVSQVFTGFADFNRRTVYLNNDPNRSVEMLFIAGQVRNERVCDYILRPLSQNEALRTCPDLDAAFDRMEAKADEMLDRSNAKAELNSKPDNSVEALEKKYVEAGSTAAVDDELAKMKEEMGLD